MPSLGPSYATPPVQSFQEVLVLWGEHDQIFPVEKAFQVARSVVHNAHLTLTQYDLISRVACVWGLRKGKCKCRKLGANARLEVLKDTGHMPQEEDPKRFNEAILNFLLPAPKSSL
jgi:pimeloyl-ACP methyl ester carboxylesterase